MAQQTTQFPPGGSLQDWAPGFSTAGSPIRGIKIDNTSGSWLSLIIPGLPVQYVPPYTLGWSMSLLTPLNTVTVNSGGPSGSVSTNSGTNVTVYVYDESIGDSAGNTYYTPILEPLSLRTDGLQNLAPGVGVVTNMKPALPLGSYRIKSINCYAHTFSGGPLRSAVNVEVRYGTIFTIWSADLTPSNPTIFSNTDIRLPLNNTLDWWAYSRASYYTVQVRIYIIYSVM
jgi:hypothetical protein